jgi:hypothetical protein
MMALHAPAQVGRGLLDVGQCCGVRGLRLPGVSGGSPLIIPSSSRTFPGKV